MDSPFPRHLDKTQRGHAADDGLHTVFPHLFFQKLHQTSFLRFPFHIDEINENDAADPAQADLAGDFFHSGLIQKESQLPMRHIPLKGARIHIDRSQSLRVVDDKRAAGGERYFAVEECFHLLIDMAGMEERFLSFMAADLFCGESFTFRKLLQTLKGRPVISDQAFDVRRHVVTQTFHREVAVTVQELGGLLHLEATADDLSDGRKRRQIAPKLFRLRLFCRGAHDGSHTGRTYVTRHSSE